MDFYKMQSPPPWDIHLSLDEMHPLVKSARAFAIEAHGTQTYSWKWKPQPYVRHLDHTVSLVQHSYPDEINAQIVGYLHDVIEDTSRTYDDILREFGSVIADNVLLCSDKVGLDRDDSKALTNAAFARADDLIYEPALRAKAADRLANWGLSLEDGKTKKCARYLAEYPSFREAIARPLNSKLIDELEVVNDQAHRNLQDIKHRFST
ncbi:hypothetical protein A3709_19980 [Halioglobus sp. HI00S01]|uniref:HD domain-containing protein n=1 Tax=Halioglobus sp. HI00S01 TaxID=1822214 RepID=UPI0007C301D3|nr:HD domain-containing protein [Halioglobus sp. HI00S01]KZX57905.1 hypothetical protein A3709_19980 [Halioglobus sp. HI00S01]